eukprot:138337_1
MGDTMAKCIGSYSHKEDDKRIKELERLCTHPYNLNGNKKIITKNNHSRNKIAMVNNESRNGGIYRWKFKIRSAFGPTIIGVWNTNYKIDIYTGLWSAEAEGKSYSLMINDGYLIGGYMSNREYGINCRQGDIICMILDLNKCVIEYIINNKRCGIAFRNIPKNKYKAVVEMWGKGDCIELLSHSYFECVRH